MAYIKIKNYTKKLNSITVLDNISYEFEAGKIYTLVGKNGSGKTMLIRAISGLITPNSGKIIVDKTEVGNGKYPSSLGLVIENITMFENMNAFSNLKMLNSISERKVSDEKIAELMNTFELDPTDKRIIKKYSLGMRQKVSIVQAFMNEPDLIILDEPTNSLDDKSIKTLLKLVKKVNESNGTTFIIASHDSEYVNNVSDEIIEMRCGKIVEKNNIS